MIAKIFFAAFAVFALAASVAEPAHTNALAFLEILDPAANRGHLANDFMARHDLLAAGPQIAVGHVKVGTADGAGLDLQEKLARPGYGMSRSSSSRGWPGVFNTIALTDALPRID